MSVQPVVRLHVVRRVMKVTVGVHVPADVHRVPEHVLPVVLEHAQVRVLGRVPRKVENHQTPMGLSVVVVPVPVKTHVTLRVRDCV